MVQFRGRGASHALLQVCSFWHARSAVAGFDLPGHCKIEPEMIFQIDPDLALRIIRERGPHILRTVRNCVFCRSDLQVATLVRGNSDSRPDGAT